MTQSLMYHIIGGLMTDIKFSERQWNKLSDANKGYWGGLMDDPVGGQAGTGTTSTMNPKASAWTSTYS